MIYPHFIEIFHGTRIIVWEESVSISTNYYFVINFKVNKQIIK